MRLIKLVIISIIFVLTLISNANGFIRPEDFGARVNDNIDDTEALQQALNAAAAQTWSLGGGTVVLSPGVYTLNHPPLRITGTVTLVGTKMSVIEIPAGLEDTALIIDTKQACYVSKIWFRIWPRYDRLSPDIAGIEVKSGNAYSVFNDLQISGFGSGIHFVNAHGYKIDHCYIVCNWYYGVWIENRDMPDANDSTITASVFDSDSDESVAAVYQEAGGGLRLVNNKILRHQYGYMMKLRPDVTTSILIINSNSIEGQIKKSVYIDTSQGKFDCIIITGNQLNCGIDIKGNAEDPMKNIIIGNNVIHGTTSMQNVKVK